MRLSTLIGAVVIVVAILSHESDPYWPTFVFFFAVHFSHFSCAGASLCACVTFTLPLQLDNWNQFNLVKKVNCDADRSISTANRAMSDFVFCRNYRLIDCVCHTIHQHHHKNSNHFTFRSSARPIYLVYFISWWRWQPETVRQSFPSRQIFLFKANCWVLHTKRSDMVLNQAAFSAWLNTIGRQKSRFIIHIMNIGVKALQINLIQNIDQMFW